MNVFVFFVSISVFVIQFANISSGQKDETNLFNFRDSKPADIVKKHLEKDKPGFQDGKIVYFENSDYSDEKGKHVEENCSDLNSEICSPNFEDVPTDEENREIANNGQKTQFLDQPSILRSLFLPAMISSYVNRNNLKPRWINKRGETNPDSRPEALKRAILRNKMIRLHRRDGLKVLRLRRNGKQNDDDSAVFANQQEQTVPFSAPKSWTNQEKKNMHLGSNPMGRSESLKLLRLRRNPMEAKNSFGAKFLKPDDVIEFFKFVDVIQRMKPVDRLKWVQIYDWLDRVQTNLD